MARRRHSDFGPVEEETAEVREERQGPPFLGELRDPRLIGPQPGPRSRRGRGGEEEESGGSSTSGFGGFGGGGGFGGNMGVDHDDYQPTTREVQDEELVENRLTDLLDSDSRYIQLARRRGERAAAQRGALSSSIFAGSSEASAIQAGLPIAQQDAQTYFRTASENMAAQNNMTLAKLQSATSIAQSNIAAHAQITSASIAASAQLRVKEMDVEMRKELFELGAEHDTFMERLRQEGRVELSEMGFYQQKQLEEMGFEHAVDLSELSHQQRMQIEEQFNDPRFYANLGLQRNQTRSNLFMQMAGMYANGINNMNMMDIDGEAFQRGETFYGEMFNFMMQFNDRLWGGDFPDIGGGSNDDDFVGPRRGGG